MMMALRTPIARAVAVLALLALGSLVLAARASSAFRLYAAGPPGATVGSVGQPHLACTQGDQLGFTLSDPGVAARSDQDTYDTNLGTYTTAFWGGGPSEWVAYIAFLYYWTGTSWQQTLSKSSYWFTSEMGPWRPNVDFTSWWYKYDGSWQLQYGGSTRFENLPYGYQYGMVIKYYWWPANGHGSAWAKSWEPDLLSGFCLFGAKNWAAGTAFSHGSPAIPLAARPLAPPLGSGIGGPIISLH
jgi:hypothetical protein